VSLESLPILDISLLAAGPEEASRFRDELRNAMHEVGFIYLAGHGVPQELTKMPGGLRGSPRRDPVARAPQDRRVRTT